MTTIFRKAALTSAVVMVMAVLLAGCPLMPRTPCPNDLQYYVGEAPAAPPVGQSATYNPNAPGVYIITVTETHPMTGRVYTCSYSITILEAPAEGEDAYTEGYWDGFLVDAKYWEGFDDSYRTVPDGPLLYSGSDIPYIDDDTYDAGYYDGLWYAYNDGYFVSYDYGFTIGFSEGYDIAFHPNWYTFLINDAHPEYLDGSFIDGYNDGFSEGSVFGAVDYDMGLPFDWEDAMWDYRAGTDLYIEEVGFGTGEFGDVYLYEYGVDPIEYYAKADSESARARLGMVRRGRQGEKAAVPSPRSAYAVPRDETKQDTAPEANVISYRTLSENVARELDKAPDATPRYKERGLTLNSTWLERIERYRADRQ